jgi:hypothetical protein
MASTAHPEEIAQFARMLTDALTRRGLFAEGAGTGTVRAVNRAAASSDDPIAVLPSPGLRQVVVCRPGDDGRLIWWWVWSGATREAPSEYEPLGPAADIEAAADRIANVLRLDGVFADHAAPPDRRV